MPEKKIDPYTTTRESSDSATKSHGENNQHYTTLKKKELCRFLLRFPSIFCKPCLIHHTSFIDRIQFTFEKKSVTIVLK